MQVHVDDVEAHVAGPHLAEDGVEVRAVVVEQPARLVHLARDLDDAPLEDAERARVRQHDAGGRRRERRLERGEVDVAVRQRRDLAHLHAAHRRGRRVGAVRRVRDDDLVPREVAARAVVGADHRDAGEFALGAGHRRQRDAGHPGHAASASPAARTGRPARPAPSPRARAGGGRGSPAASRANCRPAGCTSSCRSRADRSACRCRS